MLARARSLVREYTAKQLYPSALFWADKALSLSTSNLEDLASLAQCLYLCGDYQRAIHTLQRSVHFHCCPALRYLAAKCHAACKEWEEALSLLAPLADELTLTEVDREDTLECTTVGDFASAALVLQGTAHEGLGNINEASRCYREALVTDVFCEEALERLCRHHSLSAGDEKTLLAEIPFRRQCSVEEEQALRFLYQSKLKLGGRKTDVDQVHESVRPLCSNLDIVCSRAERLFQGMNVDAAYKLTKDILRVDPYHRAALLLHLALCVHKERVEELFALAQRLVSYFPQASLAWYAVGCYYLAINRHQSLRKYLTKALTLDPQFVPAHMAFGLSFATEGEHDQAIAAFSNAARVMKGSHLPLTYLGVEHYLTGSTPTATRFMKSALSLAPHDPALLQEIAVMLANSGAYAKAERYLQQAVSHLRAVDPLTTLPAWEPVFNNLGHVYRKQGKFSLALAAHERALQLAPRQPGTLTAVAFVHLLVGDYDEAVEFCNASLLVRREDQLTQEVLRCAMEEQAARLLPEVPVENLDVVAPDLGSLVLRKVQRSEGGGAAASETASTAMIVE